MYITFHFCCIFYLLVLVSVYLCRISVSFNFLYDTDIAWLLEYFVYTFTNDVYLACTYEIVVSHRDSIKDLFSPVR